MAKECYRNIPIYEVPLANNIRGAADPNEIWINSRYDFPSAANRQATVQHEYIHVVQQMEHSDNPNEWTWKGFFKWAYAYIRDLVIKGSYWNNIFERDARDWQSDPINRPMNNWSNYN